MTNPYTGRPFDNKIFMGVIYYQRLRHLVEDKIYSRKRGKITATTRQPLHGRAKGGGLRFGEMERDCVVSHGMSSLLWERMMKVSDEFQIFVCGGCGMMAAGNETTKQYNCRICRKGTEVVPISIPYACKQLIQELISVNVVPRMVVSMDIGL